MVTAAQKLDRKAVVKKHEKEIDVRVFALFFRSLNLDADQARFRGL